MSDHQPNSDIEINRKQNKEEKNPESRQIIVLKDKIELNEIKEGDNPNGQLHGVKVDAQRKPGPLSPQKSNEILNLGSGSLSKQIGGSILQTSNTLNITTLLKDSSQREIVLRNITVTLGDPIKRKVNNYWVFHSFKITILKDCKVLSFVQRRYQDFVWLSDSIEYNYPGSITAGLPPKTLLANININTNDLLKKRKKQLMKFIFSLLRNKRLIISDCFFHFLFSSEREFALFVKEDKDSWIQVEDHSLLMKFTDFLTIWRSVIKQTKVSVNQELEQTFLKICDHTMEFHKTIKEFSKNFKNLSKADSDVINAFAEIENNLKGGLKIQNNSGSLFKTIINTNYSLHNLAKVTKNKTDLLLKLKNLKNTIKIVIIKIQRKSAYEDYILSLINTSNSLTGVEFERRNYIIEENLLFLKERLLRFYKNFNEDFQSVDDKFQDDYKNLIKEYKKYIFLLI